jgi:hypothetical protein
MHIVVRSKNFYFWSFTEMYWDFQIWLELDKIKRRFIWSPTSVSISISSISSSSSSLSSSSSSSSSSYFYYYYCYYYWPTLWSSGQRSRVRFPALRDLVRSSGSGTGCTQPRDDNWGATWMESSCSESRKSRITAVWIRCADHTKLSIRKSWH